MKEIFNFFLLFYNDLDLNNQEILWPPSIYQFERAGTNLDHPRLHLQLFQKRKCLRLLRWVRLFRNLDYLV